MQSAPDLEAVLGKTFDDYKELFFRDSEKEKRKRSREKGIILVPAEGRNIGFEQAYFRNYYSFMSIFYHGNAEAWEKAVSLASGINTNNLSYEENVGVQLPRVTMLVIAGREDLLYEDDSGLIADIAASLQPDARLDQRFFRNLAKKYGIQSKDEAQDDPGRVLRAWADANPRYIKAQEQMLEQIATISPIGPLPGFENFLGIYKTTGLLVRDKGYVIIPGQEGKTSNMRLGTLQRYHHAMKGYLAGNPEILETTIAMGLEKPFMDIEVIGRARQAMLQLPALVMLAASGKGHIGMEDYEGMAEKFNRYLEEGSEPIPLHLFKIMAENLGLQRTKSMVMNEFWESQRKGSASGYGTGQARKPSRRQEPNETQPARAIKKVPSQMKKPINLEAHLQYAEGIPTLESVFGDFDAFLGSFERGPRGVVRITEADRGTVTMWKTSFRALYYGFKGYYGQTPGTWDIVAGEIMGRIQRLNGGHSQDWHFMQMLPVLSMLSLAGKRSGINRYDYQRMADQLNSYLTQGENPISAAVFKNIARSLGYNAGKQEKQQRAGKSADQSSDEILIEGIAGKTCPGKVRNSDPVIIIKSPNNGMFDKARGKPEQSTQQSTHLKATRTINEYRPSINYHWPLRYLAFTHTIALREMGILSNSETSLFSVWQLFHYAEGELEGVVNLYDAAIKGLAGQGKNLAVNYLKDETMLASDVGRGKFREPSERELKAPYQRFTQFEKPNSILSYVPNLLGKGLIPIFDFMARSPVKALRNPLFEEAEFMQVLDLHHSAYNDGVLQRHGISTIPAILGLYNEREEQIAVLEPRFRVGTPNGRYEISIEYRARKGTY